MVLEEAGRAARSLNIKAHIVEPAYKWQGLLLVRVGDSHENCAVIDKIGTAGLKGLVQRARNLIVIADSLACGLHFGREICVQPSKLGKGKGGSFDIPTLALGLIELVKSQLLQCFTQNDQRANISKIASGGFGQKGDGARRTGIDLYNIYIVILDRKSTRLNSSH